MKKIIFYISDLYKGGAQRVITNLSNFLSCKYEVTIVTTAYCQSKYELKTSVKHVCLDASYQDVNDNVIIKNIRRNRKIIKFINSYNPDVVVTFLDREIYRILSVRRFINVPIIVSFRNDPNVDYQSKLKKLAIKYLIRNADGVVFQTAEAKKFFETKLNNNKSTIIPNPLNENFLVSRYKGERDKVIVAVGKLFPQKNHKLLVKAFKRIADNFPDFNLMIYGEGDLRVELEGLIRDLELEKRVYLPGIKDNIFDYTYRASLFVLSSDYEGISNALMEAMAVGLPVISTDCPCGGSSFLINDGINGLLVPVGNEEKLAEAMFKLLSDEGLSKKLGMNANKIIENLKPDKVYTQWETFLKLYEKGTDNGRFSRKR
ncbi:glycosyltransferase family 4 protein [Cohnella sp.]|uniref:glycosyltransferase family 4 protein n=1 Tax=Cohnella sp. TaxID=1883426 RepID=UPI00356A4567